MNKKKILALPNLRKGFTLIELLVVIAMLGALAIGILILINPIQKLKQTRDGVRKGDIASMSRAISNYSIANGRYPNTLSELAAYEKSVVPKDPKHPQYQYVYSVDNNQSPPIYTLCAYLEIDDKAWCVFSNQTGPSAIATSNPSVPGGLITAPISTPTPNPLPMTPPLVPTASPTPIIPSSPLVAWYKFDETSGTSASDSSGNGNTATLINNPTWTSGQNANAVNLSGSSQYVRLPNGIVSTLNDFTIATWVNVTSITTWSRIFDFGMGTNAYMFLAPTVGGSMRYAISTSGGGSEQQINVPNLTTGWHHVAVTLSGTSGKVYVDGAQVGVNNSMTIKPSNLGNTTANYMGRSQFADPYLNGKIDDFRIYNGALTAVEVYSLFNPNGSPTPTPIPTPTSAPGNWVVCADENWFCPFSGTRQVKFGANGLYTYQTFTNGVDCKTSIFGDPAWGYRKNCSYDASSVPPLSSTYQAVPVIYLYSDSSIPDENAYRAQVDTSFQTVRTWFAGQLGGKTFDLAPAIFYKSTKNNAQIQSQYGHNETDGTGMWRAMVTEATIANNMNPCDPKRFYYLVTPIDNSFGGMMGAEGLGCTTHVLPGTAVIPSHMGRLIGGIIEPWPEAGADEVHEAQGGVAHEFGHGFGGSCAGNNDVYGNCGALPHSAAPSVMLSWNWFPNSPFFDNEKTEILKSPFIH